ncbi:SDR family NAD(P)-dependent oxidoreductase [Actinacidiphila acididurans]|uniref:SDR family oxidoreductase n=1 Tax=Actinacidiphila acididurans TaxID=2784346 RepID=A0ABS2TXX2_9ACTN|nr:SDR family oxidoreductase [Actinacidiphila acididurans]MBM9508191.1 SDR family oxidoreductase [Actinacidiphila acididurans]
MTVARGGPYPYRSALVTGASSGIGAEFAEHLARLGTDLTLVARRETRLKHLADRLTERYGVGVDVLALDLADDLDLRRAAERLGDRLRPVDLLVNCAGYASARRFDDLPLDREMHQIGVNVLAPVVLSHTALRAMRERGHGGIVQVSSIVAALPMPKSAVYGATKAFLGSFGESLHMEARGSGVHVTTVRTGLVRTEFHRAAGLDTAGLPKLAWLEPHQVVAPALRAVARGRPFVTPGAMNRAQPFLLGLLPRPLLQALVRRIYRV